MRTTYKAACVHRSTERPADDTLTWAADLIARPQRYGADARTRSIVADLLAEATR